MSAKAKLFSLFALAGVGSVEIPFLLYRNRAGNDLVNPAVIDTPQSDQATVSDPDPQISTEQADQAQEAQIIPKDQTSPSLEAQKIVEKGNCEVVDISTEELINVLWTFADHTDSYIAFLCKDTNKDETGKLSGSWTGLFPRAFLENEWKLTKNDSSNIYTTTKSLGSGNYETIFEGTEIKNSSITGTWNETPTFTLEESKDTFVVSVGGSDKSIYLVFDKTP